MGEIATRSDGKQDRANCRQ